jgi:tight adherence protein B
MENIATDAALLVPLSVFAFMALLSWALFVRHQERRGQLGERLGHLQQNQPVPVYVQGTQADWEDLVGWDSSSGERDLEQILRSWGLLDRMALDLVRAHLRLRVYEYIAIRIALAVVVGGLVYLISSHWIVALITTVPAYFLPRFYVHRRARKRVERMNGQLIDGLSFIANSLKGGSGLLQAMEDISREMGPPLSEELAQVVHEVNMGSDMESALLHLQARMASYDLELVITAMVINRRVGGNLAEILERIEHTIRERLRIHGEIKALTAEVKLSGIILATLPFFTGLAIAIISPNYLAPLFTTFPGQMMLGVGTIMLLVGLVMLKKLANIEV